jgi:hypothetical protein
MAQGEKLFEEKGKVTMAFIKEINADGVVMKQSFTSELKGHGRWPSGMNMGSGWVKMLPNGMARGKWNGIFNAADGEMITWKGSGRSKRTSNSLNGVMIISFMTMSEKYRWMNEVVAIAEVKGDMMTFSDVGYEWKL